MKIVLALSGGSGVQYGLRLLQVLADLNHEVHLVVSEGARKVLQFEYAKDPSQIFELANFRYDIKDIGAAIASGTHQNDGMIIAPCSMKTLAAISNGFSVNLIHRAADCMLKEGRKLLLLLRETPLNQIHIKNMLSASQAGATIMPASPGFYKNPQSIDDLINFMVGKILNVFGIQQNVLKSWDPSVD